MGTLARTAPPGPRRPHGEDDVDAVLVAYGDPAPLERATAQLAGERDVAVVVVDHGPPASGRTASEALRGSAARVAVVGANPGFGAGCNLGASLGSAPLLLLLNPDAILRPGALDALRGALAADSGLAVAAPLLLDDAGRVLPSQRRAPSLARTLGTALFLQRAWPHRPRVDELVRDPAAYAGPGDPDWVSGAAMLVRRAAFEAVGGFDEAFFLYREDADLCRRLRAAGWGIRFVPEAVAHHIGGASAPRPTLRQVHAASRVRYACKHEPPAVARATRAAVAFGEATHATVAAARGRRAQARGHRLAIAAALRPGPWERG